MKLTVLKSNLVFLFVSFFIFQDVPLFAQQNFTLSGYVLDAASGETLIGANIVTENKSIGATTNEYGYYSLSLPEKKYMITCSYIGYDNQQFEINLNKDLKNDVELLPAGVVGEEVIVTGERKDVNIESTEMGKVELTVESIKKLPALLGEVDPLRTLQLLPGVTSSGEGNTGFYVRGGGPDQNLVLLDEAIVYNPGHLFGFFSVFNSDALKNVALTKGGIPAKYGGRLSSVLDVSMKEGNQKKYQVDGGIGLISSRLTLQGPIVKNKSSFMLAGRRTYIDILAQPFLNSKKYEQYKGNGYFFYDVNAKFNYRFSDKDRLFVSGYFGRDVFDYASNDGLTINMPWGNTTASIRWNHLFNNKLFMNLTAVYNDYDFSVSANQTAATFTSTLFSGITDYNLKLDFDYFPNVLHNIKFGAQSTHHTYFPYTANAQVGDTEFNSEEGLEKHALENAVYIQDDWSVSDAIKINVGLRASSFHHIGPYKQIVFSQFNSKADTINYNFGDFITNYYGLEPRLSSRIKIDKTASLKFGFTYGNQYNHLVSSSTSQLPTDLWVPSTALVKPQKGLQVSGGYFKNFLDNNYEFSVEAYYKKLNNQIEFGASSLPELGLDIETLFVFGTGQSYGLELFLKKRFGKLSGWVGYTLSRTTRSFNDLKEGDPFLAKYDRTHDLSVVGSYAIHQRWNLSSSFIYGTGQNTTLPERYYIIGGSVYFQYGEINSYRMAPFHRSDFSATYTIKDSPKFYHDLVFSVYNVYNRKNPFFYYVDIEGDAVEESVEAKLIQVSLFPVLPSITWNFKF